MKFAWLIRLNFKVMIVLILPHKQQFLGHWVMHMKIDLWFVYS